MVETEKLRTRASILLTLVFLLAIFSVFMIIENDNLKKELASQKDETEKFVKKITELSLVKKLVDREHWYITGENTVSSEPNGCGEIVKLEKNIYPLGKYGFIMSPIENNMVVSFSVLTEEEKELFSEFHDYLFGDNLVICKFVSDPQ